MNKKINDDQIKETVFFRLAFLPLQPKHALIRLINPAGYKQKQKQNVLVPKTFYAAYFD